MASLKRDDPAGLVETIDWCLCLLSKATPINSCEGGVDDRCVVAKSDKEIPAVLPPVPNPSVDFSCDLERFEVR